MSADVIPNSSSEARIAVSHVLNVRWGRDVGGSDVGVGLRVQLHRNWGTCGRDRRRTATIGVRVLYLHQYSNIQSAGCLESCLESSNPYHVQQDGRAASRA
jgi:hypothetical protein